MRHGIDGWELVEYEWSPATEHGSFLYERRLKGQPREEAEACRPQPVDPVRFYRMNPSARG